MRGVPRMGYSRPVSHSKFSEIHIYCYCWYSQYSYNMPQVYSTNMKHLPI